MKDVAGRVAFVTGGASGMGLAMVRSFTAAGMKVAVADIEQRALDAVAEAFTDSNSEVITLALDVTDRASIERAADVSDSERAARLADLMANALDPAVVGDMVLHAIQTDEFYVFSHPEIEQVSDAQHAEIGAAMARRWDYRRTHGA